ncbi:hypothetical protein [Agromyces sp. SYSU T00266]|uniref:hypothetical protein n=1 Tax=Agromyces zhanjiangensis TaxID=3158562 RepID=UPI0033941AB1
MDIVSDDGQSDRRVRERVAAAGSLIGVAESCCAVWVVRRDATVSAPPRGRETVVEVAQFARGGDHAGRHPVHVPVAVENRLDAGALAGQVEGLDRSAVVGAIDVGEDPVEAGRSR